MITLSIPVAGGVKALPLNPPEAAELLVSLSGKVRISSFVALGSSTFISLSLSQPGGKGGFGKLLKSQKNLGKNTSNFDSCRDLEGRKVKRTRREEKIESLKSKDTKSEEKSEKVELSEPKSAVMLDDKYISQLAAISEGKKSAIEEGLKAVSGETKTPVEPAVRKMKKTVFDDDSD